MPGQAEPYYKGKTITMIVGQTAGSGPDTQARFNARYMERVIEGNPTVIVRNVPGAQFQRAQSIVHRAAPDGTTLYAGPWAWIDQVIGSKDLPFDYTEFTLVGGTQNIGRYYYMRTDAVPGGCKDPSDIARNTDLKIGGAGPKAGFDIYSRLALEVLNLPYTYVVGYRGSDRKRQAVLQNEINVDIESPAMWTTQVVPTMIQPGIACTLWAFPFPRDDGSLGPDPNFPDLPQFMDVYKKIAGRDTPSGIQWEAYRFSLGYTRVGHTVFGPPGMKAEALVPLRAGFLKMMLTDEYKTEAKKTFQVVPDPLTVAGGQKLIDQLKTLSPELVAFLKDFIERGEGGHTYARR
jgi:tripartite-type tricarboxylate transporter receptor subunit TctC